MNLKRKSTFVVFILLVLSISLRADDVNQKMARTVAQNWLYYCTRAYNTWGGSQTPGIIAEEIIWYDDTIVGYNFIISPVGNIVVPARDELPPVKLYSDTSTLVVAENTPTAQWITEELYKIDKALDEHKSQEGKSTPQGGLVLADKVFEPLKIMLDPYEARLRPNQTNEERYRAYSDPELETKRFEVFQKMIKGTQALLEKKMEK